MFSHVDINQVICIPDVSNIFCVPMLLFQNRVAHWLADRLCMPDLAAKLQLHDEKNGGSSSLTTISRTESINVGDDEIESTSSSHIMQKWIELHNRSEGLSKSVEIAIVGKYTTQSDTYTSINKALEHAGLESNRKVIIKVYI